MHGTDWNKRYSKGTAEMKNAKMNRDLIRCNGASLVVPLFCFLRKLSADQVLFDPWVLKLGKPYNITHLSQMMMKSKREILGRSRRQFTTDSSADSLWISQQPCAIKYWTEVENESIRSHALLKESKNSIVSAGFLLSEWTRGLEIKTLWMYSNLVSNPVKLVRFVFVAFKVFVFQFD